MTGFQAIAHAGTEVVGRDDEDDLVHAFIAANQPHVLLPASAHGGRTL
jgi:hypothetical protein